jgi:serine phosphatase RsbU (regulator of sigma subunit)
MRRSLQTLPDEYRDEYLRREFSLFRQRVSLYCLITTLLYFVVAGQYLLRKLLFGADTFRSWEMSFWIILLFGTLICYSWNKRAQTRRDSKASAIVYTLFFLWAFSGIAVVYPETQLIFVFYYAFALLFTSLLIPWLISEIIMLTVLYMVASIAAYDYVLYILNYPVQSLPRFNPAWDGPLFMMIAAFIAVFIRRKEIERNIHNFVLLKRVEKQNDQIDTELDLARRVHRTLVPDSISHAKADVWVTYIPASYVSGDYAKIRFLDNNRLLLFISDVTGHGVPAALLVNRVHAEFERLLQINDDPSHLLKRLNDFILKDFEGTNMFLSGFCALIDFDKGSFKFSNYGHPTQFLYRVHESEVMSLGSQATLLGIEEGGGKYYQGERSFRAGDRLLLFTDGVIETMNAAGLEYGEDMVKRFLVDHHDIIDGDFNAQLVEELKRHTDGVFKDDIFILNIKTKGDK